MWAPGPQDQDDHLKMATFDKTISNTLICYDRFFGDTCVSSEQMKRSSPVRYTCALRNSGDGANLNLALCLHTERDSQCIGFAAMLKDLLRLAWRLRWCSQTTSTLDCEIANLP